jgi:hypothetical protein
MDMQGVSPTTASSMVDVRGVSFSTASSPFHRQQYGQWTCRVYPLPPPAVWWMCVVCPFPQPAVPSTASSMDNGHAGCIPFYLQQYGRAWCIPFHHQQYGCVGCIPHFNTSNVNV